MLCIIADSNIVNHFFASSMGQPFVYKSHSLRYEIEKSLHESTNTLKLAWIINLLAQPDQKMSWIILCIERSL